MGSCTQGCSNVSGSAAQRQDANPIQVWIGHGGKEDRANPIQVWNADEEIEYVRDYVRKNKLEILKEKLEKNEAVTKEMVFELVSENVANDESMVPVSAQIKDSKYAALYYDNAPNPKEQAKAWIEAAEDLVSKPQGRRLQPMNAEKWRKEATKNNETANYVRKKALETLRKKLKTSEAVDNEMIFELAPEKGTPEEPLVPVCGRILNEVYGEAKETDYDEALTPTSQAKAWIMAAAYFEARPEVERPKPQTIAEWKTAQKAKRAQTAKKEVKAEKDNFLLQLANKQKETLNQMKGSPDSVIEKALNRNALNLMNDSADSVKANRECVLATVNTNGVALEFAAYDFKADEEVVLAAVHNRKEAIRYVRKKALMWNDKEFVQSMVKVDGKTLEYAANDLKGDQDVMFTAFHQMGFTVEDHMPVKNMVLAAVEENGTALKFAPNNLKGDKEVVFTAFRQMKFTVENHMSVRDMLLTAVKKRGVALEYADLRLKNDKEVVLAAIHSTGGNAWIFASDSMKEDKDILFQAFRLQGVDVHQNMIPKDLMLAKCKKQGFSFQNAADSFKEDKMFVLELVNIFGETLEFADQTLKADQEVVLAAITNRSKAFEFVDKTADMWKDKNFVLQMVQWNGTSLKYAAGFLKADSEVVLAAVKQNGSALKFARAGLNQNPACLTAAGLWDESYDRRAFKAIQSVKFSLGEKTTTYATDFALAAKKDHYLKQFNMYNPNAWEKGSCDPQYTTLTHKCRGTLQTCEGPGFNKRSFKKDAEGNKKPLRTSCWRYSFRFHQEECKTNNGFMIQLQEKMGLGAGQKIEAVLAEEVGLKVFRTYTNYADFENDNIEKLGVAIKKWYESKCANMDLENVYVGKDNDNKAPPPPPEDEDLRDLRASRKATP